VGALFTGDTLFLAGCGRLVEGTPAQMLGSLARLAALPPSTRLYCGHEHTEENLRFATSVEPGNSRLLERLRRVERLRAQGLPTVPGRIEEELATNPFLRCGEASLRRTLRAENEATAFAELRRRRDRF
jgi:hydroxyacylglutathione hydrolase